MKKKILFTVLAVLTLSFVGCDRNGEETVACDFPNVIVTGVLMTGPACPPDVDCEDRTGQYLANNRGVFLLDWSEYDGELFLHGIREGQQISICGTYARIYEESAYDFFRLTISQVIR